jgi:hypothetical protein
MHSLVSQSHNHVIRAFEDCKPASRRVKKGVRKNALYCVVLDPESTPVS